MYIYTYMYVYTLHIYLCSNINIYVFICDIRYMHIHIHHMQTPNRKLEAGGAREADGGQDDRADHLLCIMFM